MNNKQIKTVVLKKHLVHNKDLIQEGVMKIKKKANYAEPKFNEGSPSVENTNFAGLISLILEYFHFTLSPKDALKILEHAIDKEENGEAVSYLPLI